MLNPAKAGRRSNHCLHSILKTWPDRPNWGSEIPVSGRKRAAEDAQFVAVTDRVDNILAKSVRSALSAVDSTIPLGKIPIVDLGILCLRKALFSSRLVNPGWFESLGQHPSTKLVAGKIAIAGFLVGVGGRL